MLLKYPWRSESTNSRQERQGSGCTYNAEDTKDSKNYCGGVVVSHKVVDGSANAKKDV